MFTATILVSSKWLILSDETEWTRRRRRRALVSITPYPLRKATQLISLTRIPAISVQSPDGWKDMGSNREVFSMYFHRNVPSNRYGVCAWHGTFVLLKAQTILISRRASAGLTISTFTVGFLGPSVFNLTYRQTAAITWTLLGFGTCCSGYLTTFGKKHGRRALVNSRYTFGHCAKMIMFVLNILTEMIFGFQACIQGGQTLGVMSKRNLRIIWGIFIIGILSWTIATAGFSYVRYYEPIAWIFLMIVGKLIMFRSLHANCV